MVRPSLTRNMQLTPMVDVKTGRLTSPWVQYFASLDSHLNESLDAVLSQTMSPEPNAISARVDDLESMFAMIPEAGLFTGYEMNDVAYDAANFSASGSMTWTVEAGDQLVYKYILMSQKLMFLIVDVELSSVTAPLDYTLNVKIPASKLPSLTSNMIGYCIYSEDGGASIGLGRIVIQSGSSWIEAWKPTGGVWAASTDLTNLSFQVFIPIQ